MKRAVLVVLFFLIFLVEGRYYIKNDGSIVLRPADPTKSVNVRGELVVNGTAVGQSLSSLLTVENWLDLLNLNYISTLKYQQFAVAAPLGLASARIGNDQFLAISNVAAPNNQVYRWNLSTSKFDSLTITMSANNRDFAFFKRGGSDYLSECLSIGGPSQSYLYDSGTRTFSASVNGPPAVVRCQDLEYFSYNGNTFIAEGTEAAVSNFVWRLSGSTWTNEFPLTSSESIQDFEYCPINGVPYLVAARDTFTNNGTAVFSYSGSAWNEISNFATTTALDLECFSTNGNYYLIIAESTTNTSDIRKWTGSTYALINSIAVTNPKDFELIDYAGSLILIAATSTNTQLYKWDSNLEAFNPLSTIETGAGVNAVEVSAFVAPDGNTYAYASVTANPSTLYKFNL